MSEDYKMVKNAAGRMVPDKVNGKPIVPFKGVDKHRPEGMKATTKVPTSFDYPRDGNKIVADLRTALEMAGLKDGSRT